MRRSLVMAFYAEGTRAYIPMHPYFFISNIMKEQPHLQTIYERVFLLQGREPVARLFLMSFDYELVSLLYLARLPLQ